MNGSTRYALAKLGKNGNQTHLSQVFYVDQDGKRIFTGAYPVCKPREPKYKAQSVRMGAPVNLKTVTCKMCKRYMQLHGIEGK